MDESNGNDNQAHNNNNEEANPNFNGLHQPVLDGAHQSESDSEIETDIDDGSNEYAGYQLINQEPRDSESDDSGNSDDGSGDSSSSAPSLPQLSNDQVDHVILKTLESFELGPPCGGGVDLYTQCMPDSTESEIWNSASHVELEITTEKEQQIKACMSKFKLPSSHIPQWARDIPEEKWKTNLLNQLNKPT